MCHRCDRPKELAKKIYQMLKSSGYSWQEACQALNILSLCMHLEEYKMGNPLNELMHDEVEQPTKPKTPSKLEKINKETFLAGLDGLISKKED